MSRYRIIQDDSGWAVTKNGRRYYKKTYSTKQAATDAAYRAANKGDSVQGQKLSNGQWGNERTKNTFGPAGDS